ncbi:MAG: DUF2029 domain-containing protein [Planctomycetales bacterium]|nr:DUF2029 domain-containing protein [Planctomycetales bacterium]
MSLTIGLLFALSIGRHAFGPPKGLNDFVQEWTSARNHLVGEPIYAPLADSLKRHFRREVQLTTIQVNAHPPSCVLLTLPLARFSFTRALQIWNGLSLAMLIVAVALLFSRAGLGWSPWYLLPVFALTVTSNPLAQQMLQGQLNLLLLLLLTGFWLTARSGRWAWAGVLVGVAGAIKLFPLYLGLYFLAQRRWLGVLGVGAGFAITTLVTMSVFGVDVYVEYFREVAPAVAGEFQSYWPNASISGFFRKLLDGSVGHTLPLADLPGLASLLTLATVLAMTIAVGLRCYRAQDDRQRDSAMAACVVAMLLASPITWDHYFLLLLPFLALLWQQACGAPARQAALLLLIVLMFTVRPTWIWDAVIPGDGELALRAGDVPSVGATWHVLTVLSYEFYSLVALWWLAMRSGPVADETKMARTAPVA